jgi:sporulation protein YlmC with PRC-barrel domain
MELKASDLKHKDVLDLNQGVKLGNVSETYFENFQIIGFQVIKDKQLGFLPYSLIRGIGHDAITLENKAAVQWDPPSDPGYVSLTEIMSKIVIDANGNKQGKPTAIHLSETGTIQGITTAEGGFLGIGAQSNEIPGTHLRAIGDEYITIEPVPEPVDPPEAKS